MRSESMHDPDIERRYPNNEAIMLLFQSGLLYEINRVLLHPIGLSAYVIIDENQDVYAWGIRDVDDLEGYKFGDRANAQEKLLAYFEQRDVKARLTKRIGKIGSFVEGDPNAPLPYDSIVMARLLRRKDGK